jgi:PhzF family phenazine biosynthesis protein
MKVKAYTINSFAKSIKGGNPAGVVLNADYLSEDNLKRIAGIIGFSETAFVMNSALADFRVRFFTPKEEVELCGHATIATFSTLLMQGLIKPGKYSQETKAGVLDVEIKDDLTVMMNQNVASYGQIIDKQEIAVSLNIDIADMMEELPIQVVSTGLRDIMIPIKKIDIVNAIKPNFEMVSEISRKYNSVGYHIFTLETLNSSNAYCRNLAPLYGIPEESATGTSNGALSCYLFKYGIIKPEHAAHIVIEQGYSMGKPSEIISELITEDKEVTEVNVGGKAFNLSDMEIEI